MRGFFLFTKKFILFSIKRHGEPQCCLHWYRYFVGRSRGGGSFDDVIGRLFDTRSLKRFVFVRVLSMFTFFPLFFKRFLEYWTCYITTFLY